jgi:hypothetical protein
VFLKILEKNDNCIQWKKISLSFTQKKLDMK